MLALWLAFGCSDSSLTRNGGADGLVPVLQLDPMVVDFGALATGETTTRTVTATNVGDASLNIESFGLDGAASFTLLGELPSQLGEGESATVDVAFSPTSQKTSADLVVYSDAPATPELRASLRGEGLYPALRVTPRPYDMGSVAPGCEKSGSVDLVNVGSAPLTITSAVIVGTGFSLVDTPAFPLELGPDASTPLAVHFDADAQGESSALLYVASDDPAGVTTAPVSVTVEEAPNEAADHLVQSGGDYDRTDILVYVDQSGSMVDDQTRLASNFGDFAYNLEAASTDWQAMVVTADDGCSNTGVLSPYVPDAADAFTRGVRGRSGQYTEAGLTVALHALEEANGGCNSGFLRDDSKTLAILVSDEPEQSPKSWSTLTTAILAEAPTTSIMSIVGPAPRGCTTAELGSGYIESATATGGDVFSICEADWISYFQDITALVSSEPADRLQLSWVPKLSTLVVTLDGAPWTEWTYDAAQNSLVFNPDAIPTAGQRVEAEYDVDGGVCN